MKRIGLVIALIFLYQGLAYSQDFLKNELSVSVGVSYPTAGDIYGDWAQVEKTFHTEKTGATFKVAYSRFFKESLALRVSYQQASYFASRPNWCWYCPPHPSYKIPTYSLDVGLFYFKKLGERTSFYGGGGINIMTTRTREDDWFKVNTPGAEAITPLTHLHAGPFVAGGLSIKLSRNISLKLEGEYVYNGFTMNRWNWHGSKVGAYHKEGYKLIRISPLTTLAGLSFKW